jgi:hypothetical protein
MSRRLGGRRLRVLLALGGVVVLALVVAVPSAADITAMEGQQFSGVVDSATCASNPSTVTIDWGDPAGDTSAGSYDPSTGVSGTHTYAEEGTYTYTVTYSGGTGCPSSPDTFTANVPDGALTATGVNFNATQGTGFSGTVATFTDADPGGTASDYSATISWGDGNSSAGTISGPSGGSFSVNGTHTYSAPGSESVSVTITDQSTQGGTGGESQSMAFPSSTATVARAKALFPQCPPVYANTGCQFMIYFAKSGAKTVYEDPYQGPFEAAEDALIGVYNGSTKPIDALPLSAPGLFSFDGDGICNPGQAPLLPGCRVAPHEPAGTTCGAQGDACSFPPAAGEPFGYKEPGAVAPNTQNGYEGPTTWFSNVASNEDSGYVNFSPPLQPGQSTYFSLEEPPSAMALVVGGPTQPGLPPPLLGQSVNATPVSGIVYVKLPAKFAARDPGATAALVKGQGFVPLSEARQLPVGTIVDARAGTLGLTTASTVVGKLQTGTFRGGLYKIAQDANVRHKGLTTLSLLEGLFRGAPTYASCKVHRAADGAGAARVSKKALQTFHAKTHGHFRSRGRYAYATSSGTSWTMEDRCDGTWTTVQRDTVIVYDLVRHKTITLHAHHTYLARARR